MTDATRTRGGVGEPLLGKARVHPWQTAINERDAALARVRELEDEYRKLVAAHDDACDEIAGLEEGLRPWAFLDAENIRVLWLRLPEEIAPTLPPGVVCVLSGSWPDHMSTPELAGAIQKARALLAPKQEGG